MPRGGEEIDPIGPYIDRDMASRLRRVDDEGNPRLTRDLPDLADRLNCPRHIADMRDGDQPGIGLEGLANVLRIDNSRRAIHRHPRRRGPPALFHRANGAEDRIVINVRADDVAPGVRIDQSSDRQVQGIGAIEREDKMLGPFAIEKPIQPPAAFSDQFPGLDGLGIRPAPGAGAEFGGILSHRFINSLGLGSACRSIIEIQPARGHTANPLRNRDVEMIEGIERRVTRRKCRSKVPPITIIRFKRWCDENCRYTKAQLHDPCFAIKEAYLVQAP